MPSHGLSRGARLLRRWRTLKRPVLSNAEFRRRAIDKQVALSRKVAEAESERDDLRAERDRLRDMVRRLADNLSRYHLVGERDRALLREARAAIGGEKQ